LGARDLGKTTAGVISKKRAGRAYRKAAAIAYAAAV